MSKNIVEKLDDRPSSLDANDYQQHIEDNKPELTNVHGLALFRDSVIHMFQKSLMIDGILPTKELYKMLD